MSWARRVAAASAAAGIAFLFAMPPAVAQSVVVDRDPTLATASIQLWYRAPSAGYDLARPGLARVAVAAAAVSKLRGGMSLSDVVNRAGGTLSLETYPDILMIGATVPAQAASQVLQAMTGAFFTPSINDDDLKTAIRDAGIAGAIQTYDAGAILQNRLFAQLFAAGPAHYAPVPETATAIVAVTLSDVRAFAARAFRRENAVISLAGNVDTAALGGYASGSGVAPIDQPYDSAPAAAATDVSQTAALPGLGFAWSGPPINDERAATAMDFVADYLFDPDHGKLAASVAAHNVYLNGQFVTLHNPGVLIVTLSGDEAAALRGTILDAVNAMTNPLEPAAFHAAQRAFEYHILSQIQTPSELAADNGWYAVEGNASYAPAGSGEYMTAARSLAPGFVAATVRKYLQHAVIVTLHVPRTGGTAA